MQTLPGYFSLVLLRNCGSPQFWFGDLKGLLILKGVFLHLLSWWSHVKPNQGGRKQSSDANLLAIGWFLKQKCQRSVADRVFVLLRKIRRSREKKIQIKYRCVGLTLYETRECTKQSNQINQDGARWLDCPWETIDLSPSYQYFPK